MTVKIHPIASAADITPLKRADKSEPLPSAAVFAVIDIVAALIPEGTVALFYVDCGK